MGDRFYMQQRKGRTAIKKTKKAKKAKKDLLKDFSEILKIDVSSLDRCKLSLLETILGVINATRTL